MSRRNYTRLTFRITDGAGNIIDLNGRNVTFLFLFHNRDVLRLLHYVE